MGQQESILNYDTICKIVGRFFLESYVQQEQHKLTLEQTVRNAKEALEKEKALRVQLELKLEKMNDNNGARVVDI